MQRKAAHPLKKITTNVYEDDWEKLAQFHPKLGPSRVLRELLHSHIRRIEERANQAPLTQTELDESI